MTQDKYDLKDTDMMLALNKLRRGLNELLQPEVLEKMVSLLEELGGDNPSCMLERHEWFIEHGEFKEHCPYAKMAKRLFLEENSDNVIELINWIHENWTSKLGD
jgi:hypothetical protein